MRVQVGMMPEQTKSFEIFRIIDRSNGQAVGSYSLAYHDVYDFSSVEAARGANCHDMFRDADKYKIARYRVTYELIEDDAT